MHVLHIMPMFQLYIDRIAAANDKLVAAVQGLDLR